VTKLTREQAERIYAEIDVLRAYSAGDAAVRVRIRSERPDLVAAFDDIDAATPQK